MRYRPGLDGIRALAVIAVIGVHVGYVDGGYQGVGAFFVLSGYLITKILRIEREASGTIDLRAFYTRRFLRLYPALITTVVLVAPLTFTAAYEEHRRTGIAAIFSLTYVLNIARVTGHGFSFFLDHTWSLAVEEQFYVVWPFALLILTRTVKDERRIAGLLALLGVVLVVVRIAVASHWSAMDAREAPPTDSVGLIVGSVIAFLPAVQLARSWMFPVVAACGFGLVALIIPAEDGTHAETWGTSTTTVAASLLVMHVVADGGATRALSQPWLTWIGRRSYGLYLYHFPIAAVLRYRIEQKPLVAVLTLSISLVVAAMSYRFIERPFLKRKSRWTRTSAASPT